MSTPADWWAWIWTHIAPYLPPIWVWQIITALITLVAVIVAWRSVVRAVRSLVARAKANSLEDNLTVVGAAIASGVSATGMWKFFGDVLDLWWPLRIVLFAFIEIAIITSAVRARRNMRENYAAGIDGIAVWVLTCLTAVLSSMDSDSLAEAVFRLTSPLVAAWLWERGMRLERRRLRGTSGIHWRFTLERVMVWLGLAEATDRTAGEVDAHRRLTRVALAAKRAKVLRETGTSERKMRRALAKLDKAMDQAVAHTTLGRDTDRQEQVRSLVAALYSAERLLDVPADSAWVQPVEEPFSRLADETERLNTILSAQHEAKSTIANLAMLAADATGHRLIPSTITSSPDTVDDTPDEKADTMTDDLPPHIVAAHPRIAGPSTSPSTPASATVMAVDRVDQMPDFNVCDPSVYDLERIWSYASPSTVPSDPPKADEQADDEAGKASKTEVMRAYWDRMVAQKIYPPPIELAAHATASRSLAAELRAQWVDELTGWDKRRAKKALRDKASA